MSVEYHRRLVLLATLELTLAAVVLSIAFLLAVTAEKLHIPHLLPALATFVASLILPARIVGLNWLDLDETTTACLQKLVACLVFGLVACYSAYALVPAIPDYRSALPAAAALGALGLMILRVVVIPRLHVEPLQHRVLIVGTGAEAAQVDHVLRRLAGRGVKVVGFYQSEPTAPVEVPRERILPAEPLEGLVPRLGIKGIVVAVREQRGGALPITELLNCRLRGVEVTDVPAVVEKFTRTVPVETVKSSWFVFSKGFRQSWGRRAVKRTFDVTMAVLILVAASPIMLIASLALLLESGRPLIFRQDRVGLNGKVFAVLKFRSMRSDAEKDGVPRWASADDPRVTRVGRFLRRSRIDELPQLVNVLQGEMSFVGPRPERAYFVEQLTSKVPFYGARHTLKPGLTGWAQVNYSYGASIEDAVRKLELDLYYVKNHTLLLDLLIIFKTARVVLLGQGAR